MSISSGIHVSQVYMFLVFSILWSTPSVRESALHVCRFQHIAINSISSWTLQFVNQLFSFQLRSFRNSRVCESAVFVPRIQHIVINFIRSWIHEIANHVYTFLVFSTLRSTPSVRESALYVCRFQHIAINSISSWIHHFVNQLNLFLEFSTLQSTPSPPGFTSRWIGFTCF